MPNHNRAGAKLGVVTTRGFRDVLIVGRGNRLKVYDIKAVREEALVRRTDLREVDERIGAQGDVRTALDEAAVDRAVRELVDAGAEAIVIGFINSYANPTHELRAAEIARVAAPDVAVIASAEAQPEYREYERFATAALTDHGMENAPGIFFSGKEFLALTLYMDAMGQAPGGQLLEPAVGVTA